MLSGTAATIALAIGLVAGAGALISARATDVVIADPAPRTPVATRVLTRVDSYSVPRRFTGQVEAQQSTAIAFEQGGTVAEVLVDEGDTVAEGAVLARLDTRALTARQTALRAARGALVARAELARLTTERQEALEDRGFAATQRLDEARLGLAELEALIAETDASLEGVAIDLDKAVIRAPFAGRIADRMVDTGATVGAGQSLLTLLEDAAPQMRVGLPPKLAAGLRPGLAVTVEMEGRTRAGTLVHLRPDLDPATRTRIALVRLDGAALFGQTGTLTLDETVATDGAWVPVTALRDGVRGLWTVLVAVPSDAGSVVAEEAVEILYADETRALVRGTFADGARLIESGAHRVTPGQAVQIIGG